MARINTDSQNYKVFEKFIAETNETYIFDGKTSVEGIGMLLEVIKEMGLNPMKTEDFRQGLFDVFNIEIINMPDLNNSRFILTPNHVSDLDAFILGVLNPRIRIVAKADWADNARLRQFLDIHYDLCGLDRTSLQSLRHLLSESIDYFNSSSDSRHFLVFSQGTISDFNNNSKERISSIAQKVSVRTNVPILNVFIEQASLYKPTRIVFDEPMMLTKKDSFSDIWLEREKAMQDKLVPQARFPKLSYKHLNNNKPGDPFF